MAWVNNTFAYGSILTSVKMINMQNNFEALAEQHSGAPELWNQYNGMYGFDMDDVANVSSPVYTEAMIIHEGRCLAADGNQVLRLETPITKMVGSGYDYSFGESGGAVPSSLSGQWPVIGSQDTFIWQNMFLIKNTTSGSMDWGLDTDIKSASNLMIEVNSVNGGGWDSFRRLGSLFIFDAHRFMGVKKRGNVFQRNTDITMTVSASNNTSYFPLDNIGPTGTECLIYIEYMSTDRGIGDYVFIKPAGVSSSGDKYGLYGNSNPIQHRSDNVALMVNSGNCVVKVSSNYGIVPIFQLNWWTDPFKQ